MTILDMRPHFFVMLMTSLLLLGIVIGRSMR
jgi:hypothetical protein